MPEFQKVADGGEWKTAEQGAVTLVLVAASPLVTGITERFFGDCNEARVPETGPLGLAPHACDPGAARRLWEVSAAMLRIRANCHRARASAG